jgi:very-short-patch-repair endonuclease
MKETLSPNILQNARELRARLTDAEQLLWHVLRNRSFCGYKFRRQHPVGRYILDFYCHEQMLAVELDGGGHGAEEQAHYDSERTKELEGAGLSVLRFWNNQVLTETESVLLTLFAALTESPSPGALRHPLPEGEGLSIASPGALIPSPPGRRWPQGG